MREVRTVNLSKEYLVAATTDGAANVRRAVNLIGLRRQKCSAHGPDIVVKKVISGKEAIVFDFTPLDETQSAEKDRTGDDSDEESDAELGESGGIDLEAAVDRLRDVAREFENKTTLMDEMRRATARPDFN